MQSFTTITLLTKKEYIQFFYRETYRKPAIIVFTLLALYIIVADILDFGNILESSDYFSWMGFVVAPMILVLPTIQAFVARKNMFARPCFQHPLCYTFSDDAVNIKGEGVETTFTWQHVFKIKESGGLLLLMVGKKIGHIVKKDGLTQEQIDFIKSKVVKV